MLAGDAAVAVPENPRQIIDAAATDDQTYAADRADSRGGSSRAVGRSMRHLVQFLGLGNNGAPEPARLRRELVLLLGERKFFWTAECHRFARESELGNKRTSPTTPSEVVLPAASSSSEPYQSEAEPGLERRRVVAPLLEAKGFTQTQWAKLAALIDSSFQGTWRERRTLDQRIDVREQRSVG